MAKITYALRFHRGPKQPTQPAPPTLASGCILETLLGTSGVTGRFEPIPGPSAVLNNSFALSHDGLQFFEWGGITFPDDSTLSFSSIGAGSLLGSADINGFSHGVVLWKVESGTGVFEGASGAITSNFLVNLQTEELIDYQYHIIDLP